MAAAALAVIAAVCAYYYTHDPAEASSRAPRCFFRLLTGWECPGCGAQRALHAALHLRLAEAWSYNPFVFFAFPLASAYVLIEAGRRRWPRFHAAATRPAIIAAIFVAIVAFWILRNL